MNCKYSDEEFRRLQCRSPGRERRPHRKSQRAGDKDRRDRAGNEDVPTAAEIEQDPKADTAEINRGDGVHAGIDAFPRHLHAE
jgi:hypothetical protein